MSDNPKPSPGLWIKLYHAILDDEKLCAIKLLPGGYFIVLVFVELLVLAGKINRFGRFMLTEDRRMTTTEISNQLRAKAVDFTNAVNVLREFELIVFNSENCLEIMNWEKYQDVDISERKKEQDRIRQSRKRSKKVSQKNPMAQNPDQQTFDDYASNTDIEPTINAQNTHVTEMSRQSHANVAPIDTDIDLDLNADTDDKTTVKTKKVSSSSLEFNAEEEDVIKKYVEYKFLNGEIIKNRSGYEKSVRANASIDKGDFGGMRDYIEAYDKKVDEKRIKAQDNLFARSASEIETAKNDLQKALSLRLKNLSEADQKYITKKAIRHIHDELPDLRKTNQKPWPVMVERFAINEYHHILREAHFESAVKEDFCTNGETTDIDRLEFTIDFAIANKLSIAVVRSILEEHKIQVPKNYSILYRDKETVKQMLGVYSKFDWIKDKRAFDQVSKEP